MTYQGRLSRLARTGQGHDRHPTGRGSQLIFHVPWKHAPIIFVPAVSVKFKIQF